MPKQLNTVLLQAWSEKRKKSIKDGDSKEAIKGSIYYKVNYFEYLITE
jgi:hypothetical protein